jgi:nucleoside-diphosphate-sugar epimerase
VKSISDSEPEFNRSNAVLVTGANGFVGRHLCSMLAENAWRVVATGRQFSGTQFGQGVRAVSLPLMSAGPQWQEELRSVGCVVHLAGMAHQPTLKEASITAFREVNVEGTRAVAEEAARAEVRRFVFVSSIKVNGEGESARPYQSSDVPNPRDAYGQSKMEAEIVLRDICHRSGMDLVVIRPPLIYGPGVRANFYRFMQLAALRVPLPLGSIRNSRSFLGIWNFASFVDAVMRHPRAAGDTWLVSDAEDLSTPMLLRKLRYFLGRSGNLFPCSPALLRFGARLVGLELAVDRLCESLRVDATPALVELGWRPPLSVDEGLSRTVAAFLSKSSL